MAYRPQANGLVERRNKELLNHLRSLVYEKRIRDNWSYYLPLVQRILNYTIDGSIGTQPARVILGDLQTSDLAMDIPADWSGRNVEDCLVKLREGQATLVRATREFLNKNQRKRASDGREKRQEVTKFEVGQYVLLKYPNKPPDKLSALYRGPIEIVAIDRPDIIKVRDLTTDKVSVVHTSRLRLFRHPAEMTPEELEVLAGIDVDEYFVESIIDHEERGRNVKNWKFRVRWSGYEPDEDSWLNWNAVKDLAALDKYSQEHPELKLG